MLRLVVLPALQRGFRLDTMALVKHYRAARSSPLCDRYWQELERHLQSAYEVVWINADGKTRQTIDGSELTTKRYRVRSPLLTTDVTKVTCLSCMIALEDVIHALIKNNRVQPDD